MSAFTVQDRFGGHLEAALKAEDPSEKNYHIRSALQQQIVDNHSDPGEPVFDSRLPPLPLGEDGDELDVIVDPDGTAVIYDPSDNDAAITSDQGIVWLEDCR